MKARRSVRLFTLLWALLQFALPTGASYADALIEREGVGATAHIESASSPSCRPVHPADCVLCHLVLRIATPAGDAPLPVVVATVVAGVERRAESSVLAQRAGLPSPRAPPVG